LKALEPAAGEARKQKHVQQRDSTTKTRPRPGFTTLSAVQLTVTSYSCSCGSCLGNVL